MTFLSKLSGWFNRGDDKGDDKGNLQQNMEKALRMKQEAGPQTNIPEHQTSRDGGVAAGQVNYTDTQLGPEPTFTPNLKRSHVARSGDT